MSKKSAGILLYRFKKKIPEVFIVHPGGPYWANKDHGAWSIPKGEFTDDESPVRAAKREFEEETGFSVSGDFMTLTPVRMKSGKMIYAFALQQDIDPGNISSNTVTIEWPPKSGQQVTFPEIDRGEWVDFNTGKVKLNPSQAALLDELEQKLNLF